MTLSPERVRRFIINRYPDTLLHGQSEDDIAEDFDLLMEGVIDSFGLLELISAIEAAFEIDVDLEALSPDDLTKLGPLSRFVAQHGQPRSAARQR
jgi:acyl carrier protein